MQRLATALALLAFAVYLIWLAPHPIFLAGDLIVALFCFWEFRNLVFAHGIRRPGVFGLLAGCLIFFGSGDLLLLGLSLLAVASLLVSLRQSNLRDILPQVSCEFFGALYVFAPWRFAAELRDVSVHLLFFALALNWVGDSAAFYAGRRIGRHKLAPVVSPKKSWEGSAASVLASVLFGVLYLGKFQPSLPPWAVALMAVVANLAGQFGDLAESALKRGAGVKDSGTLLPGHGGVLDRLDSSLFALPAAYATYLLIQKLSSYFY